MTRYKRLETTFLGVPFENPVMLSSSPVSNTGEMVGRAFDAGFGGVVFKTIGVGKQKIIHPGPRMAGYDYHADRLVGLQNVEQISDRPMKDNLADLAYLKKHWPTKVVVASIMGFDKQEWRDLAKASEDAGADMLELNFSCPHMTVEGSGMEVGRAQALVGEFTSVAKNACNLPVLAKLTPNITDITEPARYAKEGGADGLTAINTVQAISGVGLDDLTPRPNVAGKGAMSGYSGPAVKPIGLRCVAQLAQAPDLGLPVSGCGGIETWIDAAEYFLLGAGTLQITTGVIHYGYRVIEDILEGLDFFLADRGVASLDEIRGKALPNLVPTDQFDLSSQGVADYDLDRCVGCGQCYVVCQDGAGQAIEWDAEARRPIRHEDKCLGCMICSFVCPVTDPPMIQYRVVPGKPEILPPVAGAK